jgi:hypothetical protein
MKPEELRINNYYEFYSGTCVGYLLGIKYSPFSSESKLALSPEGGGWAQVDLEDLTPIILTDEWFIKWGFYKDGEYWSRGIDDYKFCFKYRDWAKNWAFYQEFTDSPFEHDEGVKYSISFDIEFVHQIQNLWFALLHKEITDKED